VLVQREGKNQTLALKLAAATAEMTAATGTGNIVVHNLPGSVAAISQSTDADPESQRIWETIGIRVLKIARTSSVLLNSKYEGGLQVVSVRPDSPAARSGIQQRDVLVGLDRYQTVKMTDVAYVLDHHETDYVRFHIYRTTDRASDTLYGDMAIGNTNAQLR